MNHMPLYSVTVAVYNIFENYCVLYLYGYILIYWIFYCFFHVIEFVMWKVLVCIRGLRKMYVQHDQAARPFVPNIKRAHFINVKQAVLFS